MRDTDTAMLDWFKKLRHTLFAHIVSIVWLIITMWDAKCNAMFVGALRLLMCAPLKMPGGSKH